MAIQAQMYAENLGLPLRDSQDWLMDLNTNNNNHTNSYNNFLLNGCGFNELSFNLQPNQVHQQQLQYHHLQQQKYIVPLQNVQQRSQIQFNSSDNGILFLPSSNNLNNYPTSSTTSTTTSSDQMPINFPTHLAVQLEKQRQEIDRYISLQNERLKVAMAVQSKHQVGTLLRRLEGKAMELLKEKDEEIAKGRKRRMELEEAMRKVEVEKEGWQRMTEEKEAMVVSLSNTFEQLKQQKQQQQQAACCLNSSCRDGVDDAESCCDDNDYPCNTPTATGVGGTGTGTGEMMKCRVCNSRAASVLLLPCRHLCSCNPCEGFLDVCPVCASGKKASIEALIA